MLSEAMPGETLFLETAAKPYPGMRSPFHEWRWDLRPRADGAQAFCTGSESPPAKAPCDARQILTPAGGSPDRVFPKRAPPEDDSRRRSFFPAKDKVFSTILQRSAWSWHRDCFGFSRLIWIASQEALSPSGWRGRRPAEEAQRPAREAQAPAEEVIGFLRARVDEVGW